jgi:imidazolonepropionase-like amidohydrolase
LPGRVHPSIGGGTADAGVKYIEHEHMLDEPTIKLLAERGVWLSIQPFLLDEDAIPTAPGSPTSLNMLRTPS